MSDTPRTDAVKIACGFQAVPEPMFQHARQLERENAALRTENQQLRKTEALAMILPLMSDVQRANLKKAQL